MVNDGTLRSTADFASTLSNVNNVKISNLLEFLIMLLLYSHCFHKIIICRKLQDNENIHGKISGRSFFPFSPATFAKTYLNGYFTIILPLASFKNE